MERLAEVGGGSWSKRKELELGRVGEKKEIAFLGPLFLISSEEEGGGWNVK